MVSARSCCVLEFVPCERLLCRRLSSRVLWRPEEEWCRHAGLRAVLRTQDRQTRDAVVSDRRRRCHLELGTCLERPECKDLFLQRFLEWLGPGPGWQGLHDNGWRSDVGIAEDKQSLVTLSIVR